MLEITKNRYNYFYVWNSVGLTGLVPPCHRAFMGPKFFQVGILWVPIFSSWVFRGSKMLRPSVNFSKKQKATYD